MVNQGSELFGTLRSSWSADLTQSRLVIWWCSSSERKGRVRQLRDLRANKIILKWILKYMGSQCTGARIRNMYSCLNVLVKRRLAAVPSGDRQVHVRPFLPSPNGIFSKGWNLTFFPAFSCRLVEYLESSWQNFGLHCPSQKGLYRSLHCCSETIIWDFRWMCWQNQWY